MSRSEKIAVGLLRKFRSISSMNWSAADCKSMMMVMKKRKMKMNTTAIITINWSLYIWYNKSIYICNIYIIYICTYLKIPRTLEAIPQFMIIWILSFLFVSKRCGKISPMGFGDPKFCKTTLRLQDFIKDETQEFEQRIFAAAGGMLESIRYSCLSASKNPHRKWDIFGAGGR